MFKLQNWRAFLVVSLVLCFPSVHDAAEMVEHLHAQQNAIDAYRSDTTGSSYNNALMSDSESSSADEENGDLDNEGRAMLQKKKPPPAGKKKPPPPKKKKPPPPKKRKPPPPKKRKPPPPRKRKPPPARRRSPPPEPDYIPAPTSSPPPVVPSPEYTNLSPSPIPFVVPSPPAGLLAPPPPPRNNMCASPPRRKIMSGLRVAVNGGLRPCSGPGAISAGDCCLKCQNNPSCNAWMFTNPFDCRAQGQPNPTGLCYLISTYTGSYDPTLPTIEYLGGTAWN